MASVSAGGMIPNTSDNESQFALVSFAMGTVVGARSFKVDKLGRLTGIHYPQIWKPGENVAECRRDENALPSMSGGYTVRSYQPRDIQVLHSDGTATMTDGYGIGRRETDALRTSGMITIPVPAPISASYAPTKPRGEHTLSECSHGFYAYYDGSDDYHKPSLVSGVIEGYGESLIGTRGFRCMKAKIVALTISKELAKPVAELVARNYHKIPLFVSFEKMVVAFPPDSSGMKPAPATDEDFWDRKI